MTQQPRGPGEDHLRLTRVGRGPARRRAAPDRRPTRCSVTRPLESRMTGSTPIAPPPRADDARRPDAVEIVEVEGRLKKLSTPTRSSSRLMIGIPTLIEAVLVWFPAVASIVLSFGNWNGVGSLSRIQWIGVTNYQNIFDRRPELLAGGPAQHLLAAVPGLHRHPARHLPGGAAGPGDARQQAVPEHVLPAGHVLAGPHRGHLAAGVLARAGPDQRRLRHPRSTGSATPASTCGPRSSRPAGSTSATS